MSAGRRLAVAGLAAAALTIVPLASARAELRRVRVGVCARTISAGIGTPFAVATKMGWFREEGVEVELVPLPGSTDCVRTVATGELPFALPSVEPLAIGRPQGIQARVFYTAYQGNVYGFAVPAWSTVRTFADLKGKTIGVTSLASAGVIIARALAATAGLDPDRDVSIVVAGEGAQTAAMLRSRQVDALSQFDTQYAMVENAGVPLRRLDTHGTDRFPSNGFVALDQTIARDRRLCVALGRGYAKGTIFAIANPEAAIRILYEVFPETRPTGKDEATALHDDARVLEARIPNWTLEKSGVRRWGESSTANYAAYLDFLSRWGVVTRRVPVTDLVTNELIPEINRLDPGRIRAEAKAWKPAR
ncbi:MAG TPA: ABC transporter substrate-binding protein [Candidatus Polarisedimenticolia bacterium]|nr:ABC transporter substrate-binding protein [Candidatus Polarisedimenticolia bacterium]